METYTKIDTMYKRYAFDGKNCPKKEWLKFRNKIILGEFSNKEAEYLFKCLWEAYSKIDGTNSKIAFYPSTQEIRVGGKTDNANSQHGQFEMLEKIGERIKSQLCAMFPKESARFTPVKGDNNKVQYYDVRADFNEFDEKTMAAILQAKFDKKDTVVSSGMYGVELEEVPIYIYGEYFGTGVQKGGGRYIQNGNDFLVFDIKQQGWWLPKENRDAICKALGLEQVPFLGHMTLEDIEKMVRGGFATKFDRAADPTLIEEGIVARPVIPLCSSNGNRVIVKVKYCDYVEYDAVRKQFTDEEFTEFDTWYHENVESLYKK
jgi:uncharacterized lipoprotein YehR (DUF1307 family)